MWGGGLTGVMRGGKGFCGHAVEQGVKGQADFLKIEKITSGGTSKLCWKKAGMEGSIFQVSQSLLCRMGHH